MKMKALMRQKNLILNKKNSELIFNFDEEINPKL